jgi:hypothetical protein
MQDIMCNVIIFEQEDGRRSYEPKIILTFENNRTGNKMLFTRE